MNGLRLVLMALVVVVVSAEHYRGGTISWEPTEDGKVDIHWRLSWARERPHDKESFRCSESKPNLDGEGYLICMECTAPEYSLAYPNTLYLNCTNWDEKANWITGVGGFRYTPEEGRRNFTLSYQHSETKDKFNYNSQWLFNMKNYATSGLAWRMVTTVDLNIPNSSPTTTHPAMITLIKECGGVTIPIPVTDPDNDDVKCRWANTDSECPKILESSSTRVCGDPFPGATVDENECSYSFPVSQMEPGWYAVPITLEDYRPDLESGALSKIPLQFLIKVESKGECRDINFGYFEQCHVITPGQDWSYELKAYSSHDVEIIIERPNIDFKNGPLKEEFNYSSRVLSWTPKVSDLGKHFVLFHAVDSDGFYSNYETFTILVQTQTIEVEEPPNLVPMESYPSPRTEVTPDRNWTLKFDKAVVGLRPKNRTFITVMDENRKVAAKYDISDKRQVKISEEYPNILRIDSPYDNLKPDSKYMLIVDEGAAVIDYVDPCTGKRSGYYGSTAGAWPITTPPIPEPTVECGPSSLTVYIPLAYVEGVPANALRFIDSCYAELYNSTHYQMTTGFEECGTTAEEPTPGRLIFKNIVRDVPKAIAEGLPVTRTHRMVKINVTCEVEGLSYYDVSFTPSDAIEAFAVQGKSRLKTLLKLYEDDTYNREYRKEDLPTSVELKERLYFGLEAVNKAKDLQIISCTATQRQKPGCKAERYTFIEDGCPVDSTFRFELTNSRYEKRFSIKAFSFLFYGSTEEVLVKCTTAICKPGDLSSLCMLVLTKSCSDAILKPGVNDVLADVTLLVRR